MSKSKTRMRRVRSTGSLASSEEAAVARIGDSLRLHPGRAYAAQDYFKNAKPQLIMRAEHQGDGNHDKVIDEGCDSHHSLPAHRAMWC